VLNFIPRNIVMATVCCLFVGCDLTGQYEANFQKALEESARRAVFDQSLHAEVTEALDPAKEVKLRIPKALDANSKWLKHDEPRAQVPFIQLPGLATVLERQLDDPSQFFYLYFAAVPKTDGKAEAVQNTIAQQIAAAFPGTTWTDVSVAKPDGGTLPLKRLRVEGQQQFMNVAKKNAPARHDSRFVLYYLDGGSRHLFIGWRVPKAQAEKYQLEPAIEAAMGTVEITPSADGPKGKKRGDDAEE
jgi:hypothetical protein